MRKLSFFRPQTDEQWKAYHGIRKELFWEAQGRLDDYTEDDPEEFRENHYPHVLELNDEIIGVVRIDIIKENNEACFRHMAIALEHQGKGWGAELISQAEQFASDQGCTLFSAIITPESLDFYKKADYRPDPGYQSDDQSLRVVNQPDPSS